ncbi:GNAT family N-acetyltransferase [Pontibacillus marinus]|uniref:Acetyltransferase n=1 Tax=Pontibacillus marinus BH030004 = DSM 16465 TaxID=1385511 RepID=A0A0A5HRL9_9BACI|nr:GNAT family N-acetyltransferase [Pontibacillus marinus]KGX86277.1 acetyltransferase [Pontibacillus marinus BH030004 = DSM 16465]
MDIRLEKATEADASRIFDIQAEAFQPLLEKYKDIKTNPANESIDRVLTRIKNPNGDFYKICISGNVVAGAICVTREDEIAHYWISPMFILPEYQGQGIAQRSLSLLEDMLPDAEMWKLATILEEKRNVHLYEKIGYVRTGEEKKLNEYATLGYFQKY